MFTIIICVLAGAGAGFGTGLAGMSAAAVITPVLVAFLGMEAYSAIGIALASDILASAISAVTYAKHGNLDIKNAMKMMTPVLIFTLIGSIVSSYVGNSAMGAFSFFGTLGLGLKFLIMPVMRTQKEMSEKYKLLKILVGGAVIGSICGFVGAGGGIMMLIILTAIMRFELKTAIGTSVFIMTFTALTGSISHFAVAGTVNVQCLVICAISTLVFARVSAVFANKITPKRLNKTMGVSLTSLGILLIVVNYLG